MAVRKQLTAGTPLDIENKSAEFLFFIDQNMFSQSVLSNFCSKRDFTYFITFIAQLPTKKPT